MRTHTQQLSFPKTGNNRGLGVMFQYFGVLTVLISLSALAQVRGIVPAHAKMHAVSVLPGTDNGGRFSGVRVHAVASVPHPETPVQRVRIVDNYGKVPLAFEANQGQTDPQVKFVSRGPGYGLFLTTCEAVLTLRRASGKEPNSSRAKALPQAEKSAVLRMKLVGANATAIEVSGKDELSSKSNYFIGNDPEKWRTNVRQYAKVRYANLYPGVDLVYYGNQRELEYDFVLQPGANPDAIRLGVEGASKLHLDSGDLVLSSPGGEVRLRSPFTYQEVNGSKRKIRSAYVMRSKHEVGFRVASYDRGRPLIIDPVLAYSTYLGGSTDDYALGIAVDPAGNAYVAGGTTSTDFPTANAFQPDYSGGSSNAFVTKINATGSALVYSTYLGGSSDFNFAQSIAVDSTGSVYLTGATGAPDFPTFKPIQATNHGIRDAFVTKISPDGSALVYSTYLGGSGDDYGWGIAVDSAGNAHVTGDTPSRDFPVFKALQPTFHEGANFNSFVTEINADGSALIYSTYWGGSGGEGGSRVAVDSAGNTYIGGYTFSPDFPTVNAIQPTYAGNVDGYLTKLSADGQNVFYSTFVGGSGFEYGWDVAVDSAGNAYLTGFTESTNFPTAHALQPKNHGKRNAFVAKVNPSGKAFVFSTYLGGSNTDQGTSIAADSSGNAYVGGYTKSTNFPTANAIQPTNHGGWDAFVAKISGDGSALLYSTYLGGTANESISDAGYRDLGIAVDSAGSAYVAGTTRSLDFPITSMAFQKSLKGGADAFVAKITPSSAQAQPFAYVTNSGSSSVSVINTATNTVTGTVGVGGRPIGVAFTPDGSRAYVANSESNSVSVINTSTQTVIATIGVGSFPQGLAITPDGSRAWASNSNSASVIDTATNTVIATIGGIGTGGFAFTQDGSRTYATNFGANSVLVIDNATNKVIAAIAVGTGPGDVAITPDGTRAYVTNLFSSSVSVIDTATNTVVDTISSVFQPVNDAITPDGSRAYVTNSSATFGSVSAIDTASNTVIATVGVGPDTQGLAITPDGTHAYVASFGSNSVFVIDTATNTVATTVTVGANPVGVAINPGASSSLTTLTSSLNPSTYGQKVTLAATVAPAGKIIPTGTVHFTWDRFTIGSATLNGSGVATLTKSNLNADSYPLIAVYGGDANNPPSTSAVLSQLVLETTSTATLTSWPNPSTQGQAVTFTAKISSPTVLPTGQVTFTSGKTVLGTAQLSGGKGTLTISSLPVGSTKVTVTFYGDSNIAKSSASVIQTVR